MASETATLASPAPAWGIPIVLGVAAPSAPHRDTDVYKWRPVRLDQPDQIVRLQDEGWKIGEVIGPSYTRVWMRRPHV